MESIPDVLRRIVAVLPLFHRGGRIIPRIVHRHLVHDGIHIAGHIAANVERGIVSLPGREALLGGKVCKYAEKEYKKKER